MHMMHSPRGTLCDRARAWASLAPDGELSEIERKLLDAHLVRCEGCSAYATDVAAVTEVLQCEELAPLSRPISVVSWRRGTGIARLRTAGAVAAVTLMAIGIADRAPLPSNERSSLDRPRVTNFSNDAEGEVAQISRAQGQTTDILRLRPGRQGLGQAL